MVRKEGDNNTRNNCVPKDERLTHILVDCARTPHLITSSSLSIHFPTDAEPSIGTFYECIEKCLSFGNSCDCFYCRIDTNLGTLKSRTPPSSSTL